MKANELMVGNWCQSPYEELPFKIKAEHILHLEQGMDEFSIVGIPLTPEILVKAWFENRYNIQCYLYSDRKGGWYYQLNGDIFSVGEENIKNPIEYVHQLQNLYFALTGEELIFEL
jgi:hypothetical protein